MPQYIGLYIDNFATILGNADQENALLSYAQNNGFTTLSLYDLQKILSKGNITDDTTASLAGFISKAKTSYGIENITGIAENADFFTNVLSAYNHVKPEATERLDNYNMEFEFWNQTAIDSSYCDDYLTPQGLQCNTGDAFSFYMSQFKLLDTLAKADNCICETYVGWPSHEQANTMLPFADRILVHAYVKDPATAYDYVAERLSFYGSAGKANIIIIFSSESDFSGDWLQTNSPAAAYDIFLTAYNADAATWKNNITLLGYQWFDYGNMVHTR